MVLETSTRSAQQINMAGIIPFSKKNAVSTNGESLDSSSAQGIIINQFWITSTKLSQSEIFAIISAKLALNPIAYRSEMYGYLIELDIKSQDAISQLDILKTDKRLSIFNRSFTGGKVEKAL